MAVAAIPAEPAAARTPNLWIVSRGVDLSLVIGGSLAGYVYLLLFTVFHAPASYLWWFWSVGFDGAHIFGTASRTYFDAEARAAHPKLLYGSLLFFFALGPVMVLAGAKGWLALLVGVWAYYHVVRQHYGFMVLYKVKSRDLAPLDNFLDRLFLGVMLVAPPFYRFFVRHPEELGLPFSLARTAPFLGVLVAATAAAYLARQAYRVGRASWPAFFGLFPPAPGQPSPRKYLLFAAIIPLHWLTFAYLSWQAAVPTVTIVHNLQYHAIVWLHNRNRYAGPESSSRHGRIPAAVSRSVLAYIALAVAFSALYRIPGYALGNASNLAFGFFCGFGLTHYYLDSRIWRVRHDPGLRTALELA